MKSKGNRFLSLLTAAALCASLLMLPASAATTGVTVWSDFVGGSTAKLVSVSMGNGRTGEISLANNSVVESASVKTLIDNKNAQANTHVVAAINGGFFNSYTSKPWAYPSKCPQVMDAVVVNGKLIHTGRTATLGFDASGKAMVDWVDFSGTEVRFSNGHGVRCTDVNTYGTDPWATMVFNEHLTLPVTVPASSTMVFIQNQKVTKVMAGEKLWVPKGVDVVVYNPEAAKFYRENKLFPEVGMSAKIVLKASGTARDGAWSGVENALTGGPVLVKDGKNVVDDQRNSSFYGDPKQKPDTKLSRSFVGVTANGGLVMGTVGGASFRQIADWMVKNGIQEGIAMDGGGSCMLYADGSGFLSSGRDLAAALVIVDRAGGKSGLPAESNVGDPKTDTPQSWAAKDIQAAIAAGFVPERVQKSYRDEITRQDFCWMIGLLAQKDPNFNTKLWSRDPVKFTDLPDHNNAGADEWHILNVAQLGIIGGYKDGSFKKCGLLSRAEAAKILALTVQFFGVEDAGQKGTFTDRASFGWAEQYIDFCAVNGILKGRSDGRFDPKGTLTRQEAIATLWRIYNQYAKK